MAGLSQGLVIEASSVDRPLQRQGRLRPRSAHMRRIVRRTSRAVSLIAVCLINACGSSSVGVTPSTSASATPAAPVARGYSWLVERRRRGLPVRRLHRPSPQKRQVGSRPLEFPVSARLGACCQLGRPVTDWRWRRLRPPFVEADLPRRQRLHLDVRNRRVEADWHGRPAAPRDPPRL